MNKQKQINDLKSELMELRAVVDSLNKNLTNRIDRLEKFSTQFVQFLEFDWDIVKEVREGMFEPDTIVSNYKFKKLIKDKKNGK